MTRAGTTLEGGAIACVDGFFTANQCAKLLDDLTFAWWWPSPTIRRAPQGTLWSGVSRQRSSMTTSEEWSGPRSRRILAFAEHRLNDLFGVDRDHLEPWQAARYRRGDYFAEHQDAGFFSDDPCGERTHSLLVYLTGNQNGGSTYFPRLGQRFQPLPGRLLVWLNLLPNGSVDPRMLHAGRSPRTTKTILTTWARQRPTRNESKESSTWQE
jgi:hypothetical protein